MLNKIGAKDSGFLRSTAEESEFAELKNSIPSSCGGCTDKGGPIGSKLTIEQSREYSYASTSMNPVMSDRGQMI